MKIPVIIFTRQQLQYTDCLFPTLLRHRCIPWLGSSHQSVCIIVKYQLPWNNPYIFLRQSPDHTIGLPGTQFISVSVCRCNRLNLIPLISLSYIHSKTADFFRWRICLTFYIIRAGETTVCIFIYEQFTIIGSTCLWYCSIILQIKNILQLIFSVYLLQRATVAGTVLIRIIFQLLRICCSVSSYPVDGKLWQIQIITKYGSTCR